jgi:PhnB protein
MAQINPYFIFNGDCEAAFTLYKSIFGTEFLQFSRFSDAPAQGEQTMSAEQLNRIMHVSLPVGNDINLMGSDAHESDPVQKGNNISISINAVSRAETENIFNCLATGGKITMPLADTFWGAYFGMLTDKFGINWMVNFDEKQ